MQYLMVLAEGEAEAATYNKFACLFKTIAEGQLHSAIKTVQEQQGTTLVG